MHKVVIDTNVFISGIVFGGIPQTLIKSWLNKDFILCLSPELKAEIVRKLHHKFSFPREELQTIEDALDTYAQKHIPTHQVVLCEDPNDNFLLALAEEAFATYIISGDKKVLKLKKYKHTNILSPRDFLDILR